MFVCVNVCGCDTDLIVVSVSDGVGCDSRLLHLQQDSHGEDRLAVLTTQLHQNPVTHLRHTCTVVTVSQIVLIDTFELNCKIHLAIDF